MASDGRMLGFDVDRLIAEVARCRSDCLRMGLDGAATRLADAAKALKKARAELPRAAVTETPPAAIAVVEDALEGVPSSSRKRGRARRREQNLRDAEKRIGS